MLEGNQRGGGGGQLGRSSFVESGARGRVRTNQVRVGSRICAGCHRESSTAEIGR